MPLNNYTGIRNYFLANQVNSVLTPFKSNLNNVTNNVLAPMGQTNTNISTTVGTNSYNYVFVLNNVVNIDIFNKMLIDSGNLEIDSSGNLLFFLHISNVTNPAQPNQDPSINEEDYSTKNVIYKIYMNQFPLTKYLFQTSSKKFSAPVNTGSDLISDILAQYNDFLNEITKMITLYGSYTR